MKENVCILLLKTCIETYSALLNKPIVADGHVECVECHSSLHVGTVGIQNWYKWHISSKKCQENKVKYETQQSLQKTQLAACKFFTSWVPNVPPTIAAPKPVLLRPILKIREESSHKNDSHISPYSSPAVMMCSEAIRLLAEFCLKIHKLPQDVSKAGDDHPLAHFSSNPGHIGTMKWLIMPTLWQPQQRICSW